MDAGRSNNLKEGVSEIKVRLMPGSSKEGIIGKEGDVYRIKVTSPPVNGKANGSLISLLSKKLRIPKGSIVIRRGRNSRMKQIRIQGISQEEVFKKLDGF